MVSFVPPFGGAPSCAKALERKQDRLRDDYACSFAGSKRLPGAATGKPYAGAFK